MIVNPLPPVMVVPKNAGYRQVALRYKSSEKNFENLETWKKESLLTQNKIKCILRNDYTRSRVGHPASSIAKPLPGLRREF